MKRFLVLIGVAYLVSFYISCSTDEIQEINEVNNQKRTASTVTSIAPRIIVFGRYLDRCGVDDCVEVYKFDGESLLEDVSNMKPQRDEPHRGLFIHQVENEIRLNLPLLLSALPVKELNSVKGNIIGSPGVSDGFIYYLEIINGENKGFWVISSNQYELPKETRDYVGILNSIISVLEIQDTTY